MSDQAYPIASLSAEVLEPIQTMFVEWLKFFPLMFYALLIILIGWVLARSFRALCARVGLHMITRAQDSGHQPTLKMSGFRSLNTLPHVVGSIGFWLVMLFFIAAALQALGLSILPMLAKQFGSLIPHIFVALVVFTVTFILTKVASEFISGSGLLGHLDNSQPAILLLQIAIWSVAILVIVDQLGVRSNALLIMFSILCAALFFAFAISFGLGAKSIATNILSIKYVQKSYSIGDTVAVDGCRGVIVEITSTSIVLSTEDGHQHVPGYRFVEENVLKVDK